MPASLRLKSRPEEPELTFFSDDLPPNDFGEQPKSKAKNIFGYTLLGLVLAVSLAASFLPTPYVIERPGPAFNVLGSNQNVPVITVSGAETYPTDGALDLLTVSLLGNPERTPSWFDIVTAAFDPAQNVLPVEDVFPPNESTTQVDKQNALMFEDSQQQATAVALSSLGYRYGKITYVAGFGDVSPAKKFLRQGDVIKTIDGVRVKGILSVRKAVQHFSGKPLEVVFERDGKLQTVEITPFKDKETDAYRLGVFVGTKYDFPIDVQLQLQDVGGPSGGTMFALGIYDKLTPGSLTGGEMIAGTGTIDENGSVGEIGGIRQKLFGAVRNGATWFLAPAGNCNEVVGHVPNGLTVIKISNFTQALAAVKQIGETKSAKGFAGCTK